MALPLYLAMTAREFAAGYPADGHLAWMACHFACYETGLENLPAALPEGAMLIVNDRVPICGHDPILIAEQLADLAERFSCSGILLDFQCPDDAALASLCRTLSMIPGCPVGVCGLYAKELDCPVFLPALPLRIPLSKHLSPWCGREVWLEVAVEGQQATVTEDGTHICAVPIRPLETPVCHDTKLHVRYHWQYVDKTAQFQIQRTREELGGLLAEAADLGVTRAIGLYQQLKE